MPGLEGLLIVLKGALLGLLGAMWRVIGATKDGEHFQALRAVAFLSMGLIAGVALSMALNGAWYAYLAAFYLGATGFEGMKLFESAMRKWTPK